MNSSLLKAIKSESGLSRNTVMSTLGLWQHGSGGRPTERTRKRLLAALQRIEQRCRTGAQLEVPRV